MGIYTEGSLHYSGAGVLIIEDYYMKNGKVEPCIVLVKNKASGEYSDFGGSYESKHNTLQNTASIELREESRNLFNVSDSIIERTKKINIPALGDNFYRMYLLKINGVCRKYFLHNKKIIDDLHQQGTKIPRSWRETEAIAHIPIKNINFDKLGVRGRIILQDIDDNAINLNGRTKKAIYHAKTHIMDMVKQEPLAKRKDMIINESSDWTNMTYSYVLE